MQRSRAAADEAALLLAGLALREPGPEGDSPGRRRRGARSGPGDEAAPALGRRGKGGGGGPEAGVDGPSRAERGPRRAAVPELSAQPAGSPRASLAGSDGGSARSSGISLGYDQRHGSPRSGRSDPRPGPGPRQWAAPGPACPAWVPAARWAPTPTCCCPTRHLPRAGPLSGARRASPFPAAFAAASPSPGRRTERGRAAPGYTYLGAGAGAGGAHGARLFRYLHQVWAWHLWCKASVPGNGEPVSH